MDQLTSRQIKNNVEDYILDILYSTRDDSEIDPLLNSLGEPILTPSLEKCIECLVSMLEDRAKKILQKLPENKND
jgi:hypothetical protein